MHSQVLSCVWLCTTPWTVACQVPLSMEFSKQEYWAQCSMSIISQLNREGKTYYKATVINIVWSGNKWNRSESPEVNPLILSELISTRVLRQFKGERIIFSANSVEKTGCPHAKNWNWTPSSHHTWKLTQMNHRCNIKAHL